MRIKFKAPDPRAGTIAQMDSSRGQFFIDTGAASVVRGDDEEEQPAKSVRADEPVKQAAKKAASKKA